MEKNKQNSASFSKNIKKPKEKRLYGKVVFLSGNQKTQKQRNLVWDKLLGAFDNNVPVVLLGADTAKQYERYIKKNVKSLEIKDDVGPILFTSGSTGNPKAIQHTKQSLIRRAEEEIVLNGITRKMSIGDFAGINTMAGLISFSMSRISGAKFEYIDQGLDYHDIVRQAVRSKISYLTATAMQWRGIAQALGELDQFWDLKVARCTAGSLDEKTRKILSERTNCKILGGYGMTETGRITDEPSEKIRKIKKDSVGKATKGVVIKIIRNKKLCAAGKEGEIVVDSDNISPSVEKPFFSGDLGYLDTDGYLYLTGRKEDMLKIRGHRVNILQIEKTYGKYPACVFGVPSETKGNHEAVVVFEGAALKVARQYVEETEPPVNKSCRPRWVFTVKKMPKTVTGKIDRNKIKKYFTQKIEKMKKEEGRDFLSQGERGVRELAKIFENILHIKGVQENDSFFELGGKSLRVMSLVSAIRRQFEVEVFPKEVYKKPKVKELAHLINAKIERDSSNKKAI